MILCRLSDFEQLWLTYMDISYTKCTPYMVHGGFKIFNCYQLQ